MAERLSLREIGETALREIAELVGCPAEGVTGMRRDDDHWVVSVEVLEVGRVPETADVLATYEAEVEDSGAVVGFQRVRRYLRAEVQDR